MYVHTSLKTISILAIASVVLSVNYVPQANLQVNSPVVVKQKTGSDGTTLSKVVLGNVYCDKGAILGCPGVQLIDSGGSMNDQVNGCGPDKDDIFSKTFNKIIDTE